MTTAGAANARAVPVATTPHQAGVLVNPRLLVIEDDASLREAVSLVLERSGFTVATAVDGMEGIDSLNDDHVDGIVLDLMLPGMDGFDVLREIRRQSSVPIIVLTARTETSSLVAALELGADDYITKPFDPAELVARLRAALRRSGPHDTAEEVLMLGDLEVDVAAFRLRKGGELLDVSATEFRILVELVRAGGRVLSREHLLHRVWNYDYLGDSRLVDMAIKRLRDKIEDSAAEPRYVETVRGVGYRALL